MDNNMLNILKNLDAAEKGENVDGTPSLAASEKNAMKSLLETLDAGQRSVNQMPGDHKMAKSTTAKHPAKGYLVGGEEGEPDAGDEVVNESDDVLDLTLGELAKQKRTINVKANGLDGTLVFKKRRLKIGSSSSTVYDIHIKSPGGRTKSISRTNEETDVLRNILDRVSKAWNVQISVDESINEGGNLRTVKVTYSNGDSVTTDMAAGLSDEQIYDYFAVGKRFNLGNPATGGDNVQTVTDVEILDQVTEVDDGDPAVTMDDVVETWKSVFPNSSVAAGKSFGGGYSFKFRLSSGPEEVANGIMDNDPLGYTAFLEPNGIWRETASSMLVAPAEGSHMAYDSVKFRKKKAKNITVDQLHKRFMQVKDFVIANADRLHNVQFDILDKITEAAFGERKPAEDVHKKQSFADIFKSMEEADEEKEFNLEKEFYNKLQQEKELSKGDNGKFNLAEKDADTTGSPVKTRDARAKFLIKQARAKYAGKADDDLGAVVNMMTDKDRAHDTELRSLDSYDHNQDSDINYNDQINDRQEDTIADILDRLNKIEKK